MPPTTQTGLNYSILLLIVWISFLQFFYFTLSRRLFSVSVSFRVKRWSCTHASRNKWFSSASCFAVVREASSQLNFMRRNLFARRIRMGMKCSTKQSSLPHLLLPRILSTTFNCAFIVFWVSSLLVTLTVALWTSEWESDIHLFYCSHHLQYAQITGKLMSIESNKRAKKKIAFICSYFVKGDRVNKSECYQIRVIRSGVWTRFVFDDANSRLIIYRRSEHFSNGSKLKIKKKSFCRN